MTASVCKKCNDFMAGRMWCVRKGIYKSPWDTMCDEEILSRKERVDNWLDGHGKGKI
jgi:hypothetical protein